jgi:hypothetical protein
MTIVATMRAELGCLSNTPANRMVASDRARKIMSNRNWRNIDISRHFPTAIALYFTHSPEDLEIKELSSTRFLAQLARGSESA